MQYSTARQAFDDFTASASGIVRQLGLAGIGIVWLFTSRTQAGFAVPRALVAPTILIVVGLGLDLVQSMWAAGAWHVFIVKAWRNIESEDAEVQPWTAINWPTTAFFWLKQAAIVWAYVKLGVYLWELMKSSVPTSAT